MRVIFFFILFFTVLIVKAQFTNTHSQSSQSTLEIFNGGVKVNRGFINTIYPDTATANLQVIDFYPGSQIFVNDTIYLRDVTGTRWIKQGISGAGSGTLTNFSAGNLSPIFTTNVANPSTTPVLTFTLSTQTANTIFAGPASGGAATPTFRTLVAADISGLVTASEGLSVSGLDVRLGGPIGSPAIFTTERTINTNRSIMHWTNGIASESGGGFWQFSHRPWSPYQFISQDTVTSTGQVLSIDKPLTGLFARRVLYYNSGAYRTDEKTYGHYTGLTYSFQDTMTAYTAGGDYHSPLVAEYRIKPRNNGYSAFRTGHGTGTNLRRQEGIAAIVANMYVDAKDDAATDTLHVNGTLVGVTPYLVAATGAGKMFIDNVVYVQPGNIINSNVRITKSFLFSPAISYGTGLVDSAFGYFDTTRIVRSYHAGNVAIGVGAWSTSNALQVYGTTNITGAVTLGNLGGSGSGVVAVDNNGLLSWSAAGGGSSLFPTTGTGTATGNVIGNIGSNTLKVQSGGNDFLSIDPTAGAENVLLRSFNATGDDNIAHFNGVTSNTIAAFELLAQFDNGSEFARIEALTSSGGSGIAYTADTHTFSSPGIFSVSNGANDFFTIDPTAGDEKLFLKAYNTTDGDNEAVVNLVTSNTSASAAFGVTFDGESRVAGIIANANVTTATLEYQADTHEFTGDILTATDNTYDIGSSSASFQDIYGRIINLDGSTSGTIVLFSDALANVLSGTNLSGTGTVPIDFDIVTRADETLANTNADQPMFTNTAHDLITIQANTTYDFEIRADFTHGAVSHNIEFGMIPTTATITSIEYNALGWVTAVGTNTASQNTLRSKVTATTQVIAAGANATETLDIRGTFTVGNTGGSIMPTIQFSADPTGTVLLKTGARFKMTARGNDTFTEKGPIN